MGSTIARASTEKERGVTPALGGDRLALAQHLYETMREIATVEQTLLSLFDKGLLSGTVHTSLGQEGVAAGVVLALNRERDIVFSNHRCHGHFLAYCGDVAGLLGEVMGRRNGVCAGVGGSQHLQKSNFYSNGVLGGIVPVATGMALAEKVKGENAIVTVFLGDGAMAQGAVYESFNMAALWRLPILYVIEDNGYAQSTPKELEQAGDLRKRGAGWDIPTTAVDGGDALAVYDAAASEVRQVRNDSAPRILYALTYRLGPHSKGDDIRDKTEIERARERQPLNRLRAQLDDSWCDECDRRVEQAVAAIVERCISETSADFYELARSWQRT